MRRRQRVRQVLAGGIAIIASLQIGGLPAVGGQVEARAPARLTLAQALERAFSTSPVIVARRSEVQRAEARALIARTYRFNPELEVAAGDRQGPLDSNTDRSFGVSQEIEIAGQRRKRVAVAAAALEAAQLNFERELRLLVARVELAFSEAVRARELLEIADADVELARELLHFSMRRLDAGSGTQVELNLARSAAGQAERTLRLSQAADETTRNRLAELVGLPAGYELSDVVGDLSTPDDRLPELDELAASAFENRADLAALRQKTESARRAIQLSKSLGIPNLRVGAFYEEEEGTDDIKGLAITIPIPLFNRNQGEVDEAEAELVRLTAEGSAAELAVRREVADALASYRSAQEAATSLRELVVGTLEDNLALLRKALDAGKIGATDVLIFRREFVEGQRQFIEALFEAQAARIALHLATGRTLIPITSEQENLP